MKHRKSAVIQAELDALSDELVELDAVDEPTEEQVSRSTAGLEQFKTLTAELAGAKEHEQEMEVVRSAAASAANREPVGRGEPRTPAVVRRSESARGDRSMDELLWATDESVQAGTINKAGLFQANPFGARNAVEQVMVRSEAGLLVQAPRLAEFRPEHHGIVRSFQSLVGDMILFGLMVDRQAKSSGHGFEVARSHRLFRDRWQHILRAMDVDTAAEGGTWVPTGIGANMHEKVRAAGKVAPLFSRIDLPTNPWKWPIEGADATAYRVAEPIGDTETKMTASTPGTGAATFDAEIFGARALFSRSLEADSALAVLPYVRRKLVQAFVDAEERAVLDGDTDGSHQDSDIGASTTDARTAWDGLRKRALANAGQALTAVSSANIATLRKAMGKWGLNPADLALIVGVSGYHALLPDANLVTVDKMGAQATILNGQIGSVYGVPVIASEHVRENLNATGVYDGTTTTKTYFLLVNRNEWAFGQRMALDVEVDDSIYRETYQRVLVGFMREDFQNIGDATGNKDTAVGFNTTP
jgi:HK97 family phage major capsid protein